MKKWISGLFVLCFLLPAMSTLAQSSAAVQANVDDHILTEYFAKHNIQAAKTPSGLYYVVTQKGVGATPKPGQSVTVYYTGKTLDGKTFDSNTDEKFHHTDPLTFSVGMSQVIGGWDEGLQLFNTGSKGTLYIPSGLAYGREGAHNVIPPDAILIFDVELTDIEN